MTIRKIGLFGGTFDPVHFGHLNLAIELCEKGELDEVWWVPALLNPHKGTEPLASLEHRIATLELALKGIPRFHIKNVEGKRAPPSYTVDTIREFISHASCHGLAHRYFLLMGEDAVARFSAWHLPEEILKMVSLLIGSRCGLWQCALADYGVTIRDAIQAGLITTRLMDISATDVRRRLVRGAYCGHLVPQPVLEYIKTHALYQGESSNC